MAILSAIGLTKSLDPDQTKLLKKSDDQVHNIIHAAYMYNSIVKEWNPITDSAGKQTRAEVIQLFSCSTQLSIKFILLINVKMQTIVGILTFISTINTTCERLKARNFFICPYFSFYEQLKFRAQLS